MVHPVLTVFAVIIIGALVTVGIVSAMDATSVDARGNPLSGLDSQAVEAAADEPYVSPRLLTSM